jgi:Transglycosylase
LCVLVGGIAFAAGGYLGLIEGVRELDELRTYETHPTYIYSAPLGGNEDSRRVIASIFDGQNRKTASLSEIPSHLLDAVVAKEDERFREHGGVDLWGIMRALWVDIRTGEAVEEIWKAYTKVILSGEPIEQFDGVRIPERTDPAADPKPRVRNDPEVARERPSASPGAQVPAPEPRRVAAARASASSVFPSRARGSRAERTGAARYRSASASASAASR